MVNRLVTKSATVDWEGVKQWTAAGALAGVPIAALYKLMSEFKNERATRKMQYGPSETDENTIVLTLPKHAAATLCKRLGCATPAHYKCAQQPVAAPDNSPDPMGWALKIIGAGAGGLGTYALINELYKRHADAELKQEEAKAKHDMLRVMMGPKQADTKSARSNSIWDPTLGTAILLSLLGTGGTAYLTKKILDERAEASDPAAVAIPKVKRIVFRGQSAKTAEELSGSPRLADSDYMEVAKLAADTAFLQAATYSMMDLLRGDKMYILSDPAIKAACPGLDLDRLCKVAREAKSADELLAKLAEGTPEGVLFGHYLNQIQTNPEFVQELIGKATSNSPVTGWLARGANKLAPDLVKRQAEAIFRQQYASGPLSKIDNVITPIWSGIKRYGKPMLAALGSAASNYTPRPMHDAVSAGQLGVASAGSPAVDYSKVGTVRKLAQYNNAKILGTLANAVIVSKAIQSAQEIEAANAEKKRVAVPPTPKEIKEKIHTVQVAATDPESNRYIATNRKRLVNTLRRLAEEDKI